MNTNLRADRIPGSLAHREKCFCTLSMTGCGFPVVWLLNVGLEGPKSAAAAVGGGQGGVLCS